MGLAPYGKHNSNIPTLFKNGRGKNLFLFLVIPLEPL
jgi:hypothetical protein